MTETHDNAENGHVANSQEIPDFEQQIEELQKSVTALQAEKANLHDQMLQANLYELQQRRECDALREELSRLRAQLSEG